MSSEQLLKIGDVATLLGVTTQSLRNWTNIGYLDAVIGKGEHRRFRRSEMERLMELKERESIKRGVVIKKAHPAYTSLIGKYKYSRLYNLSTHVLASYVIARKSLGFKEPLPPIYKWLLAQIGDIIKPRLKPSNPYCNWAKLHDFIKHSGITSFKTSEVMKKAL